ncbi:MAG: PAS domain S-box protein [Acidobacteriota bacterium]
MKIGEKLIVGSIIITLLVVIGILLGLAVYQEIIKTFQPDEYTSTALHRNFFVGIFFIGLFTFIYGYLFSRAIANSIKELKRAVGEISQGNLDTAIDIKAEGEIGILADSFRSMVVDLRNSRDKILSAKDYTDKLLRSMINTLIVVSPEGMIESVNDAACATLGYQKEELIGQPISKIFVDQEEALFSPERLSELDRNGSICNVEKIYLAKDGCKIPVIFSASVIRDDNSALQGIVCVAQDITERKQVEEELRETNQALQALIEASPLAIAALDLNGKVKMWNPAAEQLFGWREQEVLHHSLPIGPYNQPTTTESLQMQKEAFIGESTARFKRGDNLLETRRWRRDGTPVDIIISTAPIRNAKGALSGTMAVMADITEHKRAEEALRIKTEQLAAVTNAMTAYLEDGNWQEASAMLLRCALSQTASTYGFTGVVLAGPVLRILAHEGEGGYLEFNNFNNLFGKVITSGKAILTNFPDIIYSAGGLPDDHTSLSNFLGVPILRSNEVVGLIVVANRPSDYSNDQQTKLEILAQAAGVLYDNYRRREREAALEEERREAEERLRESREQLRALSAHLHSLWEEERTRIAREIHDEVGQALTALKIDLTWLGKKLSSQPELLQKIGKMIDLIDNKIQAVRKISSELRPGVLDDLGLVAAIEFEVQEFQERTGIECDLIIGAEDIILSPTHSTAIFRILQEALTNVARHAEATKVDISLSRSSGQLRLEVCDNGKGISNQDVANPHSLGLIGMRERVLLCGGEVQISGSAGNGTIVRLVIPVSDQAAIPEGAIT